MFYTISQQGQRVIEVGSTRPTLDELKKLAQECRVDLYVIQGERVGIEYTRPAPQQSDRFTVRNADGMVVSVVHLD